MSSTLENSEVPLVETLIQHPKEAANDELELVPACPGCRMDGNPEGPLCDIHEALRHIMDVC